MILYFKIALNKYLNLCTNLEKRLYHIKDRTPIYSKALYWGLFVSTILFLPYLSSAYFDFITTVSGESVNTYYTCLEIQLDKGIESGSFLFIPISLSSGAYIDYLFEDKLNTYETIVHLFFASLLVLVIGTFTCISIKNQINDIGIFKINIELVHSMIKIIFFISLTYSIGVKSLVVYSRKSSQL